MRKFPFWIKLILIVALYRDRSPVGLKSVLREAMEDMERHGSEGKCVPIDIIP